MSNTLPTNVRQRVWRMYCARFGIVTGMALFVVGLVACLSLVPSYLALHIGEAPAAPQSSVSPSQQSDRAAIVHAQALLSTLSPLLSSTTTSSLIEDAVNERPATIQIYHITATAGHPGTIILTGTAGSIDAVSQYQKILRADPHFTDAAVPVGDLAGTANGQFSITLAADFGI